jgi:hypothetical protein
MMVMMMAMIANHHQHDQTMDHSSLAEGSLPSLTPSFGLDVVVVENDSQ